MFPRKLFSLLLLAALCAAGWFACAETPEIPLLPGALVPMDLSAGDLTFAIAPAATTSYDVCAFPEEGEAITARLCENGTPIAEGSALPTLLTCRLEAGHTYALTLTGAGRFRLELARHALSRCFDDPKPLDPTGDNYSKPIVKSGDAHWYSITAAQSAPLMLCGLPETPGLQLEARLFNPSGRLLAEATRTAGGAFLMDFKPRPGRAYRVRVSAIDDATGLYTLTLAPGAGGLPEALRLSEPVVVLEGRESRALAAEAIPEGAAGAMLWESSDTSVATVTRDGVLHGVRPGTAVVTAYAAGGLRARCRVEVRRVAVVGIELITRRVRLNVGDDAALEWRTLPENASDPGVTFEADPEGIVAVDENGVLRAVKTGAASVILRTADGGFTARAQVSVAPARKRYRALLVGEQRYDPEAARTGSANSVAGMRSMLNALNQGGSRFETVTALDLSRDALLNAIAETYEGATDRDTALFYITCHGSYAHGMTVFEMSDGSELTAYELRRALEKVPGAIVVLIDCCASGGAIGKIAAPGDILSGFDHAFEGASGPNVLGSSRFRVLCSAMVGQDSYRLSFDAAAQESATATLFARAVCEGCGWSIDAARRLPMRADLNYDGAVSLDELYRYARRRVMWYLSLTGSDACQTVCAAPDGDARPMFERTEAKE